MGWSIERDWQTLSEKEREMWLEREEKRRAYLFELHHWAAKVGSHDSMIRIQLELDMI